jgi:hypothetical protein
VGHVEGRLVGPFLVLLAAAVLAAVRVPAGWGQPAGHLARACLWVLAALLGANVLFDAGNVAAALRRGEGPAAHPDWRVARLLREQGLRDGDAVGFVGFTFDAYWARLAGLRLVAEVPQNEAPRFWAARESVRTAAMDAFRRAGSRVVVARLQGGGAAAGWHDVPGTDYVWLPLDAAREPSLAAAP